MAVIITLRYFTGIYAQEYCILYVYNVVVKKVMFAISSPDELLVNITWHRLLDLTTASEVIFIVLKIL